MRGRRVERRAGAEAAQRRARAVDELDEVALGLPRDVEVRVPRHLTKNFRGARSCSAARASPGSSWSRGPARHVARAHARALARPLRARACAAPKLLDDELIFVVVAVGVLVLVVVVVVVVAPSSRAFDAVALTGSDSSSSSSSLLSLLDDDASLYRPVIEIPCPRAELRVGFGARVVFPLPVGASAAADAAFPPPPPPPRARARRRDAPSSDS